MIFSQVNYQFENVKARLGKITSGPIPVTWYPIFFMDKKLAQAGTGLLHDPVGGWLQVNPVATLLVFFYG